MYLEYLDFEKPIAELDEKISALASLDNNSDLAEELKSLNLKSKEAVKQIFDNLDDWQIVQIARHPKRPYAINYINDIFDNFVEMHGDGVFADDRAIIGGMASLDEISVMVIGQQKGRTTKEKLNHNFGMSRPEGYRKALKLMRLAEKFSLPIITLVDTPGAYPGIGAEERGQSESIATNLSVMPNLKTPIISCIIGEGGSGGALAISVADKLLMLQYSIYSVISPEGCASILYKDANKASLAAKYLKLTSNALLELGLIDRVIPEPLGGAHRGQNEAGLLLKDAILSELTSLKQMDIRTIIKERHNKILNFGEFEHKK